MKKRLLTGIILVFLLSVLMSATVLAASGSGEDLISSGFDAIYNIIAAIVSSVGALLLLWGVFEWAQSLNTQDGAAQSMAFKRVAAGLVAILAPQLIPIIQNAIGG